MASARSTGSHAPSHQHIRTRPASITRAADGSHAFVEGIAYLSLDPVDGQSVPRTEAELRIDSYVTWMRRATLERFAHQFLRHARAIDSQHDHREVGELVESYITRADDPTYPPDVWVTKVRVTDAATLKALDAGELTGFSIEFVSPITIRVLDIEGHGKVRTGEITDPLPLYLSLVERPSIGIAFESVEVRAVGAQSAARGAVREFSQTRSEPDAQALGRVTRLVSVNMDASENKGTEGAQPLNASDVISTEAQTRADEGAERTKAEPAGAVTNSTPDCASASTEAFTLDAISAERRTLIRGAIRMLRAESRSIDYTDFAACWAALKDARAMWDAHEYALCLYEWTTCEIRWSSGEENEKPAKIEKAARDFAVVVAEIAQAFPGYVASASDASGEPVVAQLSARAGKKISAANMAKVQSARDACAASMGHLESARDACAASMGHLDELIALGAAVEAEGDGAEVVQESEARTSAQPPGIPVDVTVSVTSPAEIRAMVDAIMSERLAPIVAEHAKTVSELRASSEQAVSAATNELTQARAALALAETATEAATKARTEAEAACAVAQKRVKELEDMPMVPRGGTDETTAHDAGKTPAKRSVWEGTLFPIVRD